MVHFNQFRIIAMAVSILSLSSCMKKGESYFEEVITFSEVNLAPETYWNGEDGISSYIFWSVAFNNYYEENEGEVYWEGFAYSNIADTAAADYDSAFCAYLSKGGNPLNTYSVVHVNEESATMFFASVGMPMSVWVTNTALVRNFLLNGDEFTAPFEEGDWFMITATGYDINNEVVNASEFYLADYREEKPYIIEKWTFFDLTSLSGSTKVIFTLSSSVSSESALNVPAYFCIDNFHIAYSS